MTEASQATYIIEWTPKDPGLPTGETFGLFLTKGQAAALAREMDREFPDFTHRAVRRAP